MNFNRLLCLSESSPVPNNNGNHPTASSSPGGEGRGEGELNTNSYGDKSSSQLASEIEENHNRPKTPSTNPSSTASEKIPKSNDDTNHPVASPSPRGDLSRLGSGERNLAEPKVAQQPSERARASQRRDEGELKTDSISPSSSNPAGPLAGIASAISRVVHSCSSAVTGGKDASNSKLAAQNPHLSAYERALLEGKTFLEALHIHSTTPVSPQPQPQGTPKPNPLDAFSQPADPPSGYPSLRLINFRPESRWKIWG
jgi:hypothetical protein